MFSVQPQKCEVEERRGAGGVPRRKKGRILSKQTFSHAKKGKKYPSN